MEPFPRSLPWRGRATNHAPDQRGRGYGMTALEAAVHASCRGLGDRIAFIIRRGVRRVPDGPLSRVESFTDALHRSPASPKSEHDTSPVETLPLTWSPRRSKRERGKPLSAAVRAPPADFSALAPRLTPGIRRGAYAAEPRRGGVRAPGRRSGARPGGTRRTRQPRQAGSARAEALSYLGGYYMSGIDWRKSAEVLWDALGEAGADPPVRADCEAGMGNTFSSFEPTCATLHHMPALPR